MAIANSKDQNRLMKLALEDGDQLRRLVAAHTLTDQKLLAKAAGAATDELVRHAAAVRLNGDDPASLKHLAETATDKRVQSIALAKLKEGQGKDPYQPPEETASQPATNPPGPNPSADLPSPKKPKNKSTPANERRAYAPDLTPPKKPIDPAANTPLPNANACKRR